MPQSRALLVAGLLVLASGCATPTPPTSGADFASAVKIDADNQRDGIRTERIWIASYMPDYRVAGQNLAMNDGRHYDIVHLEGPNGAKRDIYFDIGSFYLGM